MLVALSALLVLRVLRKQGSTEHLMEEAYEFAPSHFQTALSAAGVGSLLWSLESSAFHCTENLYEILGQKVDEAELTTNSFMRSIHPDDRSAFELAVERVKSGRRRSSLDCRFVRPEGGVVWTELTMRLVNGGTDGPMMAGVITDVTERKQVESQLNRGVAYLEAILENTKNIIFSFDSQYRLTVFNSRFQANLRASYGKKFHIGDNLLESTPPELVAAWEPRFERALAGESFQVVEEILVRGKRFYFDVSLNPIRESGQVTGATVHSRNITEQKVREREWVEAKERAEESDRLKSAFLANMSHEIRTPLNAVMGFAQLLRTGDGTAEERDKFLDIILSNGNHLLRILGDIIELAKIESNQLRMEPVKFDLQGLLAETYSAFHDRIVTESDSLVELVVDKQIQSQDCMICDETRLRQIIYNLVSNSIKFTMKGTINVGYERKENGFVEFYVADTGPGIPAEMRERVFKRFRQGSVNTGRRNDGVGLGLSICQGLVSLLGGEIWLDENTPNGSVFRFTVRDHADAESVQAPKKSGTIEGLNGNSRNRGYEGSKVLVAEDDDMNFRVVGEVLQNENLVAVRATNGEEAIAAVEQDPEIKLVVMDISMPVLNGLDATRRIKSLRPDLPVIAHTAHAMQNDLDKALDAGCSDCLVKPINIDLFRELLARYI
ncbi:ATP-binding protein [Pelagicoccus sp. SDUM812002]|nr:ATP-binding protein [Pelagicoccus sp. SDUM812002]